MSKVRCGTGVSAVNAERLRRVYAAYPDVLALVDAYEAAQETLTGQQESYELAVAVANAAAEYERARANVAPGSTGCDERRHLALQSQHRLAKALAAWKGTR